jgi:integrase
MAVRFTDWLLEGKNPEAEIARAQEQAVSGRLTLRDLFPVFMKRHGSSESQSMQRSYHTGFKNLCRCPQIADVAICAIRKAAFLDYLQARVEQDGVCAESANKEVVFLKCMLSEAVEWEIVERNPLEGLKVLRPGPEREVYLTVEEVRALVEALPGPIADIVEFAVHTGFRKENILGLRIEAVRLHDLTGTGEVELVVKGGGRELFPLGSAATEVVRRAIGSRSEGHVFLNPQTEKRYGSISRVFDRTVRSLGLTIGDGTKVRFHDLRHILATWLHREGVSLDSLRFLPGHRDRETTDRYTTVDRLEMWNVLSLLPDIGPHQQEKGRRQVADTY